LRGENSLPSLFNKETVNTMIVTCPSCNRKYNVEDKAASGSYRKMRCSQCGYTFVHGPGEKDKTDYVDRVRAISLHKKTGPVKKRKRGTALFIISFLVLLAIAGGGYYYWEDYLGAGNQYLSIKNLKGQELLTQDSKIFLVTGTIVNRSTKPRRYVFLKCKLFARDGTVLGERFAPAGLDLGLEKAEKMNKAQLEKMRIPNEKLVLLRNGQIPFSIIYFDTEFGKAKQFSVEIYEAPL
jgi:predicted Zn finger-like uncharacterized protein